MCSIGSNIGGDFGSFVPGHRRRARLRTERDACQQLADLTDKYANFTMNQNFQIHAKVLVVDQLYGVVTGEATIVRAP